MNVRLSVEIHLRNKQIGREMNACKPVLRAC
jgi:hypothetical protein